MTVRWCLGHRKTVVAGATVFFVGSIALIPDKAYRYRRHDASASAKNTRSSVRATEEAAVIREIVAAAAEQQWTQTVRAGRLRVTARLNDWWSRRA